MFGKKPKIETVKLEAAMNRVLDDMDSVDTSDEGYSELLTHLERISKLKTHERRWNVDANTVLTVGGSLLGIGIIVVAEQFHPMLSKALGFVWKPKTL